MAEIEIAGHLCIFPQISHAILKTYGVTPYTYELAFATPPQTHSITILSMLWSMAEITAIARPPFFVEDSKERTIVLLENPNKSVLETVERWLYWTCGTQFKILCPYRIAKTKDDLKHAELWDELSFVKNKATGQRPLLGKHPRAATLPKPRDMFPDNAGNPLTPHPTILKKIEEQSQRQPE